MQAVIGMAMARPYRPQQERKRRPARWHRWPSRGCDVAAARELQSRRWHMGIPNETVMENEKREQQRKVREAKERERIERSLEEGLRDTFPASDPVSVTQHPPAKTE
jgi:hypothetical protein